MKSESNARPELPKPVARSVSTTPALGNGMPRFGPSRRPLFWLGLCYLGFVIYGSLVPLDFRPIPLAEAVHRFAQIPYLDLKIESRADWVANILLFVPLAFVWLGVLWTAPANAKVTKSWLVLVFAFLLSVGIEFTQIFFPPRTVSINDIVAEGIGTVAGIAAWWIWGERLIAWMECWRAEQGPLEIRARLLSIYVFILYLYSLLPLDLTISPVEFYHKWMEGRVVLIPFSFPFPSRAQFIYDLLTDIATWIPVAFLWRGTASRPTGKQVWQRIVFAAALLELLQLFVYSRVTDITDVLTAMVGAQLGNLLFVRLDPKGVTPSGTARDGDRIPVTSGLVWKTFLLLAWIAAVGIVFWYPFDLRLDRAFIHERLAFLHRVPFEIYYFGSEFRAITELLHKVLFFAPGGLLLAWLTTPLQSSRWGRPAGLASIAFLAALAFVVELGQVLLPSKYPDLTDWLLETVGGLIGYLGFRFVASRRRLPPHGER